MHADAMLMGNVQQLTQQVTPTVHRDDVVAEGRLAAHPFGEKVDFRHTCPFASGGRGFRTVFPH